MKDPKRTAALFIYLQENYNTSGEDMLAVERV
jgi:hypothetical protein